MFFRFRVFESLCGFLGWFWTPAAAILVCLREIDFAAFWFLFGVFEFLRRSFGSKNPNPRKIGMNFGSKIC